MAKNNVAVKEMEAKAGKLEKMLQDRGFKDVTVTHNEVWKNNVILQGFTAKLPEINIAPTVYDVGQPDWDMANMLAKALRDKTMKMDINAVFEPGYILQRVRPMVVGLTDFNLENIENQGVTYLTLKELGMILYFIVVLNNEDGSCASIKITDGIRKQTGLSVEKIYSHAEKNISNLLIVKGMNEMIFEMMGEPNIPLPFDDEEEQMYVVSVPEKYNGAGIIASPEGLKKISEKIATDEFYIIPSSIHELIVLPKENVPSPNGLLDMVIDVNSTQVEPEEQLADAVYFYDHGELKMIMNR